MEYFEDLRNINHCEFIIMEQNPETGKYILENQLRTWSDLKRQKLKEREEEKKQESQTHDVEQGRTESPEAPKARIWGGCVEGCSHAHDDYPKRPRPSNTRDFSGFNAASGISASQESHAAPVGTALAPRLPTLVQVVEEESEAFPHPGQRDEGAGSASEESTITLAERRKHLPTYLEAGRDFGGSDSGAPSPQDGDHSTNYGFPGSDTKGAYLQEQRDRWVSESGMASLARADALGDQFDESEEHHQIEDLSTQEAEDKSLRGSVY